jgi:hypothetical protein
MTAMKQTWFISVLTLIIGCGLANAQSGSTASNQSEAAKSQSEAAKSMTSLIDAANQYQVSSKELVSIQETEISKATVKLDELRTLVSEGLVARAELEAGERELAGLREQLLATQKQVAAFGSRISEIQAQQELARAQAAMPAKSKVKLVSKSYVALGGAATVLRSNGATGWSLGNLGAIQSFFSSTFGHVLPTSAIGQSATHDRLGYDHRNAVDVALYPDSTEGRALINYLQTQGIPFLAFRTAIPGVATGPHIHIGSPSHRL